MVATYEVVYYKVDKMRLRKNHNKLNSKKTPISTVEVVDPTEYREIKRALQDTTAKCREAEAAIDELQDQNQELLKAFEKAARKATILMQTVKEQEHKIQSKQEEIQKLKLQNQGCHQLRAVSQKCKTHEELEKKLKKAQENIERLANEKIALEIEHEMDEQEWEKRIYVLERKLEEQLMLQNDVD